MDRTKLFTVLRIIVSLGCIGGLIYLMRGKGEVLKDAVAGARINWLILGIISFSASLVVISVRMRIIFKTQGFLLSLKESVNLNLIGIFFNNFLPTGAGGDVVKAMLAARQSKRMLESFISCFIDRLMGIFSLVSLAAIALLFLHSSGLSGELRLGVTILISGGIVLMVIFFNPGLFDRLVGWLSRRRFLHLQSKIERFADSIRGLRKNRRQLYQAFGFSFLSQLLWVLTNYILVVSLRAEVSILNFFLIIPVIGLTSMFPSLNGLGVRELGYVVFFRGHISEEKALALSFLWLIITYLASFFGGIIYLVKSRYRIDSKS